MRSSEVKRFEGFMEAVRAKVEELDPSVEAEVTKVQKNNGVVKDALNIIKRGDRIGCVIYYDEMFEALRKGVAGSSSVTDTMAKMALDIYRNHGDEMDRTYGVVDGLDRDEVLGHVTYKLVNKNMNKDALEGMPHKDFLDMAVTYVMTYPVAEGSTMTISVSNEAIRKFGIGLDELDAKARENSRRVGYSVTSLLDAIIAAQMQIGQEAIIPDKYDGEQFLFVLTSASGMYGASVMMFGDELAKVADMVGSDLYILPSSIHEVIAMPKSVIGDEADEYAKGLASMVSEVNDGTLDTKDILSYSVYEYDRASGEVRVVA